MVPPPLPRPGPRRNSGPVTVKRLPFPFPWLGLPSYPKPDPQQNNPPPFFLKSPRPLGLDPVCHVPPLGVKNALRKQFPVPRPAQSGAPVPPPPLSSHRSGPPDYAPPEKHPCSSKKPNESREWWKNLGHATFKPKPPPPLPGPPPLYIRGPFSAPPRPPPSARPTPPPGGWS